MQSFRIQLQKIRQHLTNWTRWNKREKVWSGANSLFKWGFRSRRRLSCLSCLLYWAWALFQGNSVSEPVRRLQILTITECLPEESMVFYWALPEMLSSKRTWARVGKILSMPLVLDKSRHMVNDKGRCNSTRVLNSLFELAEAHRPTPSGDDRVNKNTVEPR